MDLKSDNLVYIKDEKTGHEVLKVIDFGGSEFINPKMGEAAPSASLVANVCRRRDTMWSDDRYTSPEQAIPCSKGPKKDAELVYPVIIS